MRWWRSDGPLLLLPFIALIAARERAGAAQEPGLGAGPLRGRGTSGARRARAARWPAITVGCVGAGGHPPGSHTVDDVPEAVDPEALERTVAFCRAMVAQLDAAMGGEAEADGA